MVFDPLHRLPGPIPKPGRRDGYHPRSDVIGALASGACAVHCAAMPVAAALMPAAAARLLASEPVHLVFAVLVLATSVLAFVPGWIRHGEDRIWGWVVTGLGLILYARFAGGADLGAGGEAFCTTAGGVVLMIAHRLNHSLAYWWDQECRREAAMAVLDQGVASGPAGDGGDGISGRGKDT